jgi:hypothetical protein
VRSIAITIYISLWTIFSWSWSPIPFKQLSSVIIVHFLVKKKTFSIPLNNASRSGGKKSKVLLILIQYCVCEVLVSR